MATDLVVRREGYALHPVGEHSVRVLESLRSGEHLAKLSRPRNLKHHKKFFAFLRMIQDAAQPFTTSDQLLAAIKVATGRMDLFQLPTGLVVASPKSISFGAMDQTEFDRFYADAVTVIEQLVPGLTRDVIDRELEAYL